MRYAVAATLLAALAGCAASAPASPNDSAAPSGSAAPVGTEPGTPTPSSGLPSTPAPTPTTPTPGAGGIPSPDQPATGSTVAGVDVSAYQPRVDWAGLRAAGVRFAFVKATEGSTYVSPTYAAQRDGALAVGMLVGGYHYARPAGASGATQARHLLAVTGGWRADGRTLPGVLDLEDSTSGPACHGRTPAQLLGWVRDFAQTYRSATGRWPLLYVKAETWTRCLGAERALGQDLPLWLFDHQPPVGPLPAGWERATFWQRGIEGGLDRNVFFGSLAELRAWADARD